MSRRIMGKASFIELKDSKGRIQVYISRDDLCPGEDKELYNTVFKKLLDIGDFIGIKGFVFRTQMGEITIHAQELTVLSKYPQVFMAVATSWASLIICHSLERGTPAHSRVLRAK